jgi:hypothetical protein
MRGFMETCSRLNGLFERRIARSLPRNSCFLSGRGSDDLESQLGGFPFELLDL